MSDNRKEIIESMLKSYDEVIEHYDFVINDLLSEIYDPALEARKTPVIDFLKKMRKAWVDCKTDLQKQS